MHPLRIKPMTLALLAPCSTVWTIRMLVSFDKRTFCSVLLINALRWKLSFLKQYVYTQHFETFFMIHISTGIAMTRFIKDWHLANDIKERSFLITFKKDLSLIAHIYYASCRVNSSSFFLLSELYEQLTSTLMWESF